MAEFPALPLWTDAYLSDTGHLTTIEHGAYLLLLMTMWRNDGSLPNDDKRLSRFCRLTMGQWLRIKPVIMEFFSVDGDEITQGRLTDELVFVRQHSAKQSNAAKARWLKTKGKDNAKVMPKASQNDAPTPTIDSSSLREKESARAEQESWWLEFWAMFPNKVGKADAGKAFLRAIKRVDRKTMIEGLRRYVSKTDDRPWCNPSTWLNQDRWADMPAQVSRSRHDGQRPKREPDVADLANGLLREMEQAENGNSETPDGDDRQTQQLIPNTQLRDG